MMGSVVIQMDDAREAQLSMRAMCCSERFSGAQSIGSQEQVQRENAKSTQHRDQQPTYCTQREQQCDQRLLYISLHRGNQPLATPDGLQPLPGGWHNHDTQTLDT